MTASRVASQIASLVGMPCTMIKATVLAVGSTTLTLNIRGATVQNVYKLASYSSPAVNDVVAVLAYGSTYLVLGDIG